jgi:quercetin dioxygenase-like cupin family protein
MATPDMFQQEGPDSFKSIPGFDASTMRTHLLGQLEQGGETTMAVLRSVPGKKWVGSPWHMHHYNYSITYIIKGWADFEFEGVGMVRLGAGAIMHQPKMNRHREGEASDDWEAVALYNPPVFGTTVFGYDEASGTYIPQYIGNIAEDEAFGKSLGVEDA